MKKTASIVLIFIAIILFLFLLNELGTRSGVTNAQVSESLPGDTVIPTSWITIDRAGTLPVSAAVAWPWMQQLGKDRAGWYAPLWLENLLHEHSAATIESQYQHLHVGDVVPDWGGGSLKVIQIDPGHDIVYGSLRGPSTEATSTRDDYAFTWTLVLENSTASSSSFHLRLRLKSPTSGFARYIPPSLPGLIDYATDAVMFEGFKEKVLHQQ